MSYISIKEYNKLKNENDNLKNQLQNFIPRRRVRRVFKQLNKILSQDIIQEEKIVDRVELEEAIEILKPLSVGDFITWFNTEGIVKVEIAVETILKALENSIPKEVIEKKIENLQKLKTQLPIEHIRQAQISILKELLEVK